MPSKIPPSSPAPLPGPHTSGLDNRKIITPPQKTPSPGDPSNPGSISGTPYQPRVSRETENKIREGLNLTPPNSSDAANDTASRLIGKMNEDARRLVDVLDNPDLQAQLEQILTDSNGGDAGQLEELLSGLVFDVLDNGDPSKVGDPNSFLSRFENKMTGENGEKNRQVLGRWAQDYANAPADKKADMLQDLALLLGGGAVRIINEGDNC